MDAMETSRERDNETDQDDEYDNEVDKMLTIVNGFGPFQWFMIGSFCLMILPASYQVLIMYFLALQPGYRCTQVFSNYQIIKF